MCSRSSENQSSNYGTLTALLNAPPSHLCTALQTANLTSTTAIKPPQKQRSRLRDVEPEIIRHSETIQKLRHAIYGDKQKKKTDLERQKKMKAKVIQKEREIKKKMPSDGGFIKLNGKYFFVAAEKCTTLLPARRVPSILKRHKPAAKSQQAIAQQVVVPVQQQATVPIQQQMAVPIQQQVAVPAQQQMAVPVKQQATVPIQQQVAVPVQQQATVPGQQQVAVPVQQQMAVAVHQEYTIKNIDLVNHMMVDKQTGKILCPTDVVPVSPTQAAQSRQVIQTHGMASPATRSLLKHQINMRDSSQLLPFSVQPLLPGQTHVTNLHTSPVFPSQSGGVTHTCNVTTMRQTVPSQPDGVSNMMRAQQVMTSIAGGQPQLMTSIAGSPRQLISQPQVQSSIAGAPLQMPSIQPHLLTSAGDAPQPKGLAMVYAQHCKVSDQVTSRTDTVPITIQSGDKLVPINGARVVMRDRKILVHQPDGTKRIVEMPSEQIGWFSQMTGLQSQPNSYAEKGFNRRSSQRKKYNLEPNPAHVSLSGTRSSNLNRVTVTVKYIKTPQGSILFSDLWKVVKPCSVKMRRLKDHELPLGELERILGQSSTAKQMHSSESMIADNSSAITTVAESSSITTVADHSSITTVAESSAITTVAESSAITTMTRTLPAIPDTGVQHCCDVHPSSGGSTSTVTPTKTQPNITFRTLNPKILQPRMKMHPKQQIHIDENGVQFTGPFPAVLLQRQHGQQPVLLQSLNHGVLQPNEYIPVIKNTGQMLQANSTKLIGQPRLLMSIQEGNQATSVLPDQQGTGESHTMTHISSVLPSQQGAAQSCTLTQPSHVPMTQMVQASSHAVANHQPMVAASVAHTVPVRQEVIDGRVCNIGQFIPTASNVAISELQHSCIDLASDIPTGHITPIAITLNNPVCPQDLLMTSTNDKYDTISYASTRKVRSPERTAVIAEIDHDHVTLDDKTGEMSSHLPLPVSECKPVTIPQPTRPQSITVDSAQSNNQHMSSPGSQSSGSTIMLLTETNKINGCANEGQLQNESSEASKITGLASDKLLQDESSKLGNITVCASKGLLPNESSETAKTTGWSSDGLLQSESSETAKITGWSSDGLLQSESSETGKITGWSSDGLLQSESSERAKITGWSSDGLLRNESSETGKITGWSSDGLLRNESSETGKTTGWSNDGLLRNESSETGKITGWASDGLLHNDVNLHDDSTDRVVVIEPCQVGNDNKDDSLVISEELGLRVKDKEDELEYIMWDADEESEEWATEDRNTEDDME